MKILKKEKLKHTINYFFLATPEERQLLDDALAKEDKRWNKEKKCIEEIKEKESTFNSLTDLTCSFIIENNKREIEKFNKYLQERKNLPKVGELCIFWADDKPAAIIGKLDDISDGFYWSNELISYSNCIPFTTIENYKNFIKHEKN